MDRRAGVCQSSGNGTGEVATLIVTGTGYGCGPPTSTGRLLNDNELRRSRPIRAVPAGYGVENLSLAPRGFPSEAVTAGAKGPRVDRAAVFGQNEK